MRKPHNLSIPASHHQLWPVHIFQTRYRDWPFDKTKFVDMIKELSSQQTADIESNIAPNIKTQGLKESTFDLLMKKDQYPVLGKLEDFFKEAVYDVITHALPKSNPQYDIGDVEPEIIITDCWYHNTNNGGAHGVHSHPGNSWAGIFYINTTDCDTTNGSNRFYNAAAASGLGDIGSSWWTDNNIWVAPNTEGTLILFPAWIMHEATAFKGNEDRMVIAFNSFAKVKNI